MKLTRLQAKRQYGGIRLLNMRIYQGAFMRATIVSLLSSTDDRHVGRYRGYT